jgi:hypothetical protein
VVQSATEREIELACNSRPQSTQHFQHWTSLLATTSAYCMSLLVGPTVRRGLTLADLASTHRPSVCAPHSPSKVWSGPLILASLRTGCRDVTTPCELCCSRSNPSAPRPGGTVVLPPAAILRRVGWWEGATCLPVAASRSMPGIVAGYCCVLLMLPQGCIRKRWYAVSRCCSSTHTTKAGGD